MRNKSVQKHKHTNNTKVQRKDDSQVTSKAKLAAFLGDCDAIFDLL